MTSKPTQRVAIIGASGYLGSKLATHLEKQGYEVVRISRFQKGNQWTLYDSNCLKNTQIVFNFAGKSIDCRWSTQTKQQLYDSRIKSSNQVFQWLQDMEPKNRPHTYLCASGIGIYGESGSKLLDEDSHLGSGFLPNLCKDWEAAAQQMQQLNLRVINLRLAAILGKNSSAWEKMILPYKFGVGGKLGNGNAYFAWMHEQDALRSMQHCIEHTEIQGAVNIVSKCLTHAEVAKHIGQHLKRPYFFAVPKIILKSVLGEFANAILTSINADSKVLKSTKFKQDYPTFASSLQNLTKK